MNAISYVIAANVAVWLGLGGYLLFLASRQARLERRLRQMELTTDGENQ